MWCGTLQFKYDGDKLIAKNQTHSLILDEAFDFADYYKATNARPAPPIFEDLVQQAIRFAMDQKVHGSFQLQFFKRWFSESHRFPDEINAHICSFVDSFAIAQLRVPLLPHQVEALQFVGSRKRCLLASATGLGKTIISLALILEKSTRRNLIVCPPILKQNWADEIHKFMPNVMDASVFFCADEKKPRPATHLGNTNALLVHVDSAASLVLCLRRLQAINADRVCYILLSRDMLHRAVPALLLNKIDWDMCVLDEAHAYKCQKSLRSKAAFTTIQKVILPKARVLLLSATPSSYAKDWWHLLRLIDPVRFDRYFHFKAAGGNYVASSEIFFFAERYVVPRTISSSSGEHWCFDTSVRLDELHAITRPYVLAQTKDVLHLPEFLRERVVVGEASAKKHKIFCSKMQTMVEGKTGEMKASFFQLIQEAAVEKLPFVIKYLQTMLDSSEERFIIWVHFKATMKGIADFLRAADVTYIHINGDTPKPERLVLMDMFQTNNTIRVALLSIDTCGTGLNMTHIKTTVYAELVYDHVARVQSEGRCHRIGQTADTVTAIYLIYKNSPDDLIWKSMARKADVESMVLSNKKADFQFDSIDIRDDILAYLKDAQFTPVKTPKPKRKRTTITTPSNSTLTDDEFMCQVGVIKRQVLG